MKMSLSGLDHEIHQLEERIAGDRSAFVAALSDCGHSAREAVSSPISLLAVAGLGFVAGKLIFRPRTSVRVEKAPPARTGMLGLAAAALSLMQPGFGAGGVARWAAKQIWERRKAGRQPARRGPAAGTSEVRMPAHRPAMSSGPRTAKSSTSTKL